jgi:phosphoadenosine phosphosulfate reductase
MMRDDEKMLYLLHSRVNSFQSRLSSARTIIKSGLGKMKRPYASMSFGKDSTVMIHLLLSVIPDLKVMYVNCGEWDEWPDTPRVKDEFLSRFPCEFIELHGPSIIEFYRQVGIYTQDEEATKAERQAQREYGNSLAKILDAEAYTRKFDGTFIGLRKEESDNRRRLFAMRGTVYYAKTRHLWACHPLAYWSARDVWAYIAKYNLPYNELYDLDPQGREIARNGAMIGTRSARYGRMVFLKRIYPDWFNRLVAEFPEARCYV